MKKLFALACLSLLVFPGCWRGKKKSSDSAEVLDAAPGGTEKRTSIFDENEEAFVLEDGKNPFNPEEGTVNLVEESSLWDRQQGEFETIYFEFNQDKPRKDQTTAVDRNAAKLKAMATEGTVFIIEGHACDSAGDPDYNMMLSERRARQIKKMLMKRGVPGKSLQVVGRGSEMRKVQGGNREQQAPNRRVEIYSVQGK